MGLAYLEVPPEAGRERGRFLILYENRPTPPAFPGCSDVSHEFEYSESEIKILKIIGAGDHAVVYRMAAGGRTFALKVNEAISQPGTPKLNIFYESERDAYTRLSPPSGSPLAPIPKYHGYIKFTKPPRANGPGSIPWKLFKSALFRPARDHFLNKSGDYLLQGLVLDEIVAARHICGGDASNLSIARSGREGLEALHQRGVLHGDVKNPLDAMVSVSDNNVIWMDFSMGEINANISDTSFARKASQEIRLWNRYFKASIAK
ncbi:hypothetical protein B7494_g867 [Chlorociboria aeruginascens]|nr:hypothetical protein B7494_g867 [Chlorociboria aeruginascens]